MHHVRKIRDMKNPDKQGFFTRQMAAINRKQMPLCKDHHIRLHNNTLTDEERSLFSYKTKRKNKNVNRSVTVGKTNPEMESRMIGDNHVRFGGRR
jgi:hypothetical protein